MLTNTAWGEFTTSSCQFAAVNITTLDENGLLTAASTTTGGTCSKSNSNREGRIRSVGKYSHRIVIIIVTASSLLYIMRLRTGFGYPSRTYSFMSCQQLGLKLGRELDLITLCCQEDPSSLGLKTLITPKRTSPMPCFIVCGGVGCGRVVACRAVCPITRFLRHISLQGRLGKKTNGNNNITRYHVVKKDVEFSSFWKRKLALKSPGEAGVIMFRMWEPIERKKYVFRVRTVSFVHHRIIIFSSLLSCVSFKRSARRPML